MMLFFYQLKQAYLSLKQKPGFVFSVVSTMGLTLGALLCVLTLAYVMLIKPLPYPEQDKLYSVQSSFYDENKAEQAVAYTYPGLIHLYKNQTFFSEAALINYNNSVLTSLPRQPKVETAYVTPEFFPLLGANFIIGRGFEAAEALDTFNPVVVLSYASWQEDFGNSADVLSKSVTANGVIFRIIGVLSPEFIEPDLSNNNVKTALWFPWDHNLESELHEVWGNVNDDHAFIGRLTGNLSENRVEQSLSILVNNTWQSHIASDPFFKGWEVKMKIYTFKQAILGESKNTVFLLLVGVLALVMIALANITNLFVSRSAELQHSFAIHAALGANKSVLNQTIFAQLLLLMVGVIGVALALSMFGFSLMRYALATLLPRMAELSINEVTLSAAILLVWLLAYTFSRLSTKMIDLESLNQTLITSGKGTSNQVSPKLRKLLVTSQVTIAALLIFVNLSLFQKTYDVIKNPLGFTVDNISSLTLSSITTARTSQEDTVSVMSDLRNKLLQLPQVKSVVHAASPLSLFYQTALTTLDGNIRFTPEYAQIDHQYFQTIEQPLLAGRYFSENEIKTSDDKMIINDALARKLAPSENTLDSAIQSVVGMKILDGNDKVVLIIGVVKGVKLPGVHEVPNMIYLPSPLAQPNFLITLKTNQLLSRKQVAMVLKETTGLYAISTWVNLSKKLEQLLFSQVTTAVTTLALIVITILLSTIGLFGILNYSSQTRRFEIGTRMAVGAKGRDITRLIFKENAGAIITGITISLVMLLALYLTFSDSLASYISLKLIVTFMVTLSLILLLSLFSCYLPLRKYIRKPVIHALKGSE
jgi:predicted permease